MPGISLYTGRQNALEAFLVERLAAQRARDPLGALTILVGETLLRPYLRRRLARLAGGHLNLRIVTAGELALQLGEHALVAQGREPLPFLADRVLAQQIGSAATRYFCEVADTPGFATALHRLFRELRLAGAEPFQLDLGTDDAKLEELRELYTRLTDARAPFYGADDAYAAAQPDRLRGQELIVHGIWDPAAGLRRLLARIAALHTVTVLLAQTGTRADEATQSFRGWLAARGVAATELEPSDGDGSALGHLQRELFAPPRGEARGDESVVLVSAPDPAREAREAVRACLRWAGQGIGFNEMAVAYRDAGRYPGLIEAACREAGIDVYLHEGTPLSERPLGRSALTLLELCDSNLERRAVMDFLTGVQLPDATFARFGKPSTAAWDALSREAGVIAGPAQWEERLSAHRTALQDRYGHEPPEWLTDRLDQIDNLRGFIADLARQIDQRPLRASWGEQLAFLERLLSAYVRDAALLVDALRGLDRLDRLGDKVPFERFSRVIAHSIETLRSSDVLDTSQGAFGLRGINVLSVNSLRNFRFRAVAVLGLSERSFPAPPRQDPLLLDDEREALRAQGVELQLRARGGDPEPLQFALCVQAAEERLFLSFARAETAGDRARLPSAFFRAAATALRGERIRAEDVDALPAPLFRRLRGSKTAPEAPDEALTAQERLHALIEEQPALGRRLLARLRPEFPTIEAAERARFEPALNAYDGVFGEQGIAALRAHWTARRPMSASAAEVYATCPYRYLLSNLMRLTPIEEPEAITRLGALERGALYHDVLERFLSELGTRPRADRRDEELARLEAIAQEECTAAEERGLTGYPLLWRRDRREILEDVRAWYERELEDQARFPRRAFEVGFGAAYPRERQSVYSSDDPLVLTVAGHELRFHGFIDRLEWGDEAFRVLDYKTGAKGKLYKDDALAGGRKLQLALYLHAAQLITGLAPESGDAEYWFATRRGDFRRIRFKGDTLAVRREDFDLVLKTIAEGIAEGDFHAEPGDYCRFCDFTTICDARREAIRRVKAGDAHVQSFERMREVT